MNAPLTHGRSVLVLGNGMVGHRFCERLCELDTRGQYRVTVIGEEPRIAYDRVHLTSYFETGDPDALALADQEWYRERGIEPYPCRAAVAVDPARREQLAGLAKSGEALPMSAEELAVGFRGGDLGESAQICACKKTSPREPNCPASRSSRSSSPRHLLAATRRFRPRTSLLPSSWGHC